MSQNEETDMQRKRKPQINMIAAIGKNRELGKNGELIWRVSEDLRRVKEITMGHPLIMGRKTHESIGRPLPGRTNIVISKSAASIEGCVVVNSFTGAIDVARTLDHDEIFIFGGEQVYTDGIKIADRLYLTMINATDDAADAFFPPYENVFTRVVARSEGAQDGLTYTWLILERP